MLALLWPQRQPGLEFHVSPETAPTSVQSGFVGRCLLFIKRHVLPALTPALIRSWFSLRGLHVLVFSSGFDKPLHAPFKKFSQDSPVWPPCLSGSIVMLVQILHYQCPAWLHALQEVPHWPVPDSPVFQAFELRLVQNLHVRAVSEHLPIGLPLFDYLFILQLYYFETTTTP